MGFTRQDRRALELTMIEIARADPRVTAGALVGSCAVGAEDAFSDLDISFGIRPGDDPKVVLDDWVTLLAEANALVHHFDVPHRAAIYRVVLFDSGLEMDLSAVPEEEFGPRGKSFRSLFGPTSEARVLAAPGRDAFIGWGWHHVLHARAALGRGKPWLAEYWIAALRTQILSLACVRFGLPTAYARGFDQLPAEVTGPLRATLVASIEEPELRRALAAASTAYRDEVHVHDEGLASRLEAALAITR